MKDKFTALSMPIDEVLFVQPFREQHIFTPAAKKPPHITIYSPFLEMEFVNKQVIQELTEVFSSFCQFEFTMKGTGRFSDIGVLYLSVEPFKPFKTLSQTIQKKYPELKPYISDPILHVTLARVRNIDDAEKEFYKEYGDRLPIHAIGKEVCLYEKLENTWYKRESFLFSLK